MIVRSQILPDVSLCRFIIGNPSVCPRFSLFLSFIPEKANDVTTTVFPCCHIQSNDYHQEELDCLWQHEKASLKKCSKQEAVASLARGRQCSHSTHINILHSIHFASNSLQLLSCKMIASHRSREQLVILLLMWALWTEKGCHTLADDRPEHNKTIK